MEISLLADHPSVAEKIAHWYFAEWARLSPSMTQKKVLKDIKEKSVNRHKIPLILVAHIEGELAGVLELKLRENKHYPEYVNWIGGVYTDAKFRRQGVASNLLKKAKSMAISFGIEELYLQCESFNIPLYVRLGFKELHKARHHDVETMIMMWRSTT